MSSKAAGGGVSTLTLLGVCFIVMKLCGVIDWSWWWVTVPFWGGLAFVVGILVIVALIVGIDKTLNG